MDDAQKHFESLETRLWLVTKAVSLLIQQFTKLENLLETRHPVDQERG